MGLLAAPCKASGTEDSEDLGEFLLLVRASVFGTEVFTVATALSFSFFFTPVTGASFVAEDFFRFARSSLAKVSASQGAFTLPRDAGRPLSHSADAWSPPISRMVRPVSTEVSY